LLYCSIIAYDTVASLNIAPPPPPLCPPLCAGGRPCIERSIGSAIYWVWILLNSRAFFFPHGKKEKKLCYSVVWIVRSIGWSLSCMSRSFPCGACLVYCARARSLSWAHSRSLWQAVVWGVDMLCSGEEVIIYFFIFLLGRAGEQNGLGPLGCSALVFLRYNHLVPTAVNRHRLLFGAGPRDTICHIYIYIRSCVCVCVCVCARARGCTCRLTEPSFSGIIQKQVVVLFCQKRPTTEAKETYNRSPASRGSYKNKAPAGAQSPAFSGIIKCICWPGATSRERTSCSTPCCPPTQYATNQLLDSP
jgi:hypothetical protein